MKAQTYQDIEKVLIEEPVRDVIETALIALESKNRRNAGERYDPLVESQCVFGIKKLSQLLKAFDKKY